MSPRTRRLRRYFLVGLVVIAPVGLTVWVLSWIFSTIDDILGEPLQAALGVRIPGLGFVLLAAVVLLVGWAVHWYPNQMRVPTDTWPAAHQRGSAPRQSASGDFVEPLDARRTFRQQRRGRGGFVAVCFFHA